MLRPAVRLYQDLTQILRLCLSGPFDPKAAGPGLLGLLARAADVPDFATLEAHLTETQARVRASFVRILGRRRSAQLLASERCRLRRVRPDMPASSRQAHQHDGAAPERRADAHRAAVQLGQRLGDREAEAGAVMASW